ncbi:MOB kinase activator-like 2 isoform X2 [Malaya genurostris]|uniref:MOB kinase activator-like 2 isoform X2 n=1 Tax=Malaya genurostris TaxID=325434 RepID=UPI0026F3EFDA|nr:MOB kinase activator-like 2 isoform X2 [Malaya genurostris]
MPGLFPSIDGHDSGTESDGDLEQEDDLIQEHDMELSLSSRHDTASPTDTACSSESPVFLGPASHHLLYDQNSSEEELEVINGGVLEVGAETDGNAGGDGDEGGIDCAGVGSSESVNDFGGILMIASRQRLSEANVNDDIDDCTDEIYSATSPTVGLLRPLAITPTQLAASKRCSSNNLLEKRKRSLAHSSDDEVRHLLEHQNQQHHHHHHQQTLMSAPVNFRTSPPLEALKPHRGHILQRSTTPLILTESGRGLEHIRISSSSSISSTTSSLSSLGGCGAGGGGGVGGSTSIYGGVGGLPTCDSPSSVNYSTNINHHNHPQPHHQHHHQQQQQQQHHHHHQSQQQQQQQQPHHQQQNSNNRTLLSTTNTSTATATGAVGISFVGQEAASSMGTVVTNMEISRSVSPPAKVFHCAVSPRRRQPRHQQQRLQRPHRPCLDFDKMQQLKARSVTTWRHSNEHSGELSVFCW